jgi:putative phosphoribosyl transferase
MSEKIHDRRTAGKLLASKLQVYADRNDVVVLGLARGGVAVAHEIALALHLPLDVFIVQKLGVPGYEELAMGAIGTGGIEIVNPDVVEEFRLSDAEIAAVVKAKQVELRRREAIYGAARPATHLRNQTVILVDDGTATGSTMRAAIEGVKRAGAARVVVAVGVAPLSTSRLLEAEADEVVCLLTPREFRAVGLFYDDFPQLNDSDVCDLLNKSWITGARSMAQRV